MSAAPLVLAGPCSAESREQTLATAHGLASVGIKIFRAGVWKPRTHPGGFEGIGSPALAWLGEVKEQTGMLVATEVATARHLAEAVEAGVDVVWIGARTSANPFAVQEIADALAALPAERRDSLAVLVKNPVNADLELWIGALQRINAAGIERLGAVHRGFSHYGASLYRNPPEWRVPIELHRRLPELPLICDPSHIGGRTDLIESIAQQALNLRFDGLIIESHCNPAAALSDASQQVTPARLAEILSGLVMPSDEEHQEELDILRQQIDRIDDELLELLARRMQVSRDIGRYKHARRIPIVQPHRYNELMKQRVAMAATLGLPAEFVGDILAAIHEESVRQQGNLWKQ
ncbi:MAG: bifunctional 3-deoxy-7-phosphoheptulonate synthase/chorismate mutase type II [Muribaculaceae bacterium]|nr:bifunctional 3-deoxy-7-phosphoheptulonate synthase/chorismate mutase type II [Muribaculaceae bacterium]